MIEYYLWKSSPCVSKIWSFFLKKKLCCSFTFSALYDVNNTRFSISVHGVWSFWCSVLVLWFGCWICWIWFQWIALMTRAYVLCNIKKRLKHSKICSIFIKFIMLLRMCVCLRWFFFSSHSPSLPLFLSMHKNNWV